MYPPFNALPYGKAYLFKGNSNKLWYLIKDEPNVSLYNSNHLIDLAEAVSFDCTNYIWHYQYYKTIPDVLLLPPTIRVFILFSVNDKLTDKEKALYKTYESQYYTTIDYTKFTVKHCPILYRKVLECQQDITHKLNRFSWKDWFHYPQTVQHLLNDSEISPLDFAYTNNTVEHYIKELAQTKDFTNVLKLIELDINILKKYFAYPYTQLRGIISNYPELTPLYEWFKLFSVANESVVRFSLKDLVYLYFLWVYKASTQLRKPYKEGLFTQTKGRKIIYRFRPSELAAKEFFTKLIC